MVVGFAGSWASTALNSASVSTAQVNRVDVKVLSDTPGGMALLTTLAPIQVASGASRTVPTGSQFSATSADLATALSANPGTTVPANQTLTCDLRIGWTGDTPVIDVVDCANPTANPTANPSAASTPAPTNP